jgi:DNA polymerase-3 subunit epsilon/oligoribonuclease
MLAIFLDMETTGLDQSRHHAIDIGLTIMNVTTGEYKGSYTSIIKQPLEVWDGHDPVSIEVNGYTFEKVSTGKDREIVGEEITELFQSVGIERGSAVFICQNPGFDRGFFSQLVDVYKQERLNWPYHWLDLASMYWVTVARRCNEENILFPEKINLSKNSIAKAQGLLPEETPHRAMNGVNHLIACYKAVLS